MSTTLRVSLLSLAVPALLAAPVVTRPSTPPHPVTPEITSVDVPADGLPVERRLPRQTTEGTVLALSWAGDVDDPVEAVARVRRDGRWADWQELTPAEVVGDGTSEPTRGATDLLWIGEVDAVQVKVERRGRQVRDLRVDVIDPGVSEADDDVVREAPPSTATAGDGRPTIVTRAGWGADESLRGNCSATSAPKAAFIHHTAGRNDYTQSTAAAQVRADYAYHVKTLGWCDLGYHFVVDKYGTIYEGRSAGIDGEILGAHAGGFNSETVGIAALGNFDIVKPTEALVAGLGKIAGWKLGRYGRNPEGTVVLTARGGGGTTAKYADGTQVTLPTVPGHRSVGNTACPGQYLFARMDSIRSVAATTARSTPMKTVPADLQNVVEAMYLDFLGRPADPGGLQTWSAALARGDVSQQQLALDLHRSTEGVQSVVRGLYRSILRREPDPGGISTWGGILNRDPSQVTAVTTMLYASQEYYQTQGMSQDSTWVRALYRDILKREADPVGLQDWTARARRDGRPAVAGLFFSSGESAQYRVAALYRALLGREPDPSGMQTWAPLVVQRGDMTLASFLAGSLEYYNRAQTR